MKKILIADSLDKEAIEQLQAVPASQSRSRPVSTRPAWSESSPVSTPSSCAAPPKSPNPLSTASKGLEIIVRAGIGLDNVDAAAAKARGIQVANTPSATTISVAEYTFGLMLAAVRQQGRANLTMKQHKWEKKVLHGTELYGKTLGLIGAGRIGLAVAERAVAFGMNRAGL